VLVIDAIFNAPFYIAFGAAKLGAAGLRAAEDLIVGDGNNEAAAVPGNLPVARPVVVDERQVQEQHDAELARQLSGDVPQDYMDHKE
jgi:hypothetical protein